MAQLEELVVKLTGDIAELKGAMVEAANLTAANTAKMDESLEKFNKNASRGLTTTGAAFASFVGNLSAIAVSNAIGAMANAFSSGIQTAREFSSAIGEVNSILPQTSKLTKEQELSLIRLSAQFGSNPQKQAKAFYQIVSAGVSGTREQFELLQVANTAAVAGITDVETAIVGLTNVLAVYQSAGVTATDASNMLFVAVREGKTNFQLLASNIGKVAPIAKAAGVSFDSLTAAITTVTKSGLSTEETMTGLKAAIQAIANPSEDIAKKARAAGFELGEAAIKSKGFDGVLKDLIDSTGGSLSELAKFIPTIEGAGAVAAISAQGFDEFQRILDGVRDSGGAAAAAFAEIEKSADFQLRALESEFQALIPTILNVAEGPIAEMVKGLREALPDAVLFAVDALKLFVDTAAFLVDVFNVLDNDLDRTAAKWSAWGEAIGKAMTGDFSGAMEAFENGEKMLKVIDKELDETLANNPLRKFSKDISAVRGELEKGLNAEAISETSRELANMNQESSKTKPIIDDATKALKTFAETVQSNLYAETVRLETELLNEEFENRLITEEEFLIAREQMIMESTQREMDQLRAAREAGFLSEQEFLQASLNANKKQASELNKLDEQVTKQKERQEQLRQANFRSSLNTIASLAESGNSTLATIGKAAAITTATMDGIVAVQKALAAAPPPFNFALAGLVGAATAANVAKIAGVQLQSGIDEVPGPFNQDRFPAVLAGGERVVPAETNQDLKQYLQENANGSARTINISVNVEGVAFGDEGASQLIERINEGIEQGIGQIRGVS